MISQSLIYVADDTLKVPSLKGYLAHQYKPPVLLFVSTCARASVLEEQLMIHDIRNVNCLRSDMTQEQKEEAVGRLARGDCWIMICTDEMAQGVEFKGVRTILNLDFPISLQCYMKRIGKKVLRCD